MDTKTRIADTALALFNERGIHEVGVREIARELGISPGNLSYHFPRKEDLIHELLNRLSAGNDARYQAFFSEPISIYSYLKLLDRIYYNQYAYRCLYLSMVESPRSMAEIGYDYPVVAERRRASLERIFRALAEQKEFRPDITPDDIDTLVALMALINRFWVSESVLRFHPYDPETVIRHYLKLVARQLSFLATEKGKKGIDRFFEAVPK